MASFNLPSSIFASYKPFTFFRQPIRKNIFLGWISICAGLLIWEMLARLLLENEFLPFGRPRTVFASSPIFMSIWVRFFSPRTSPMPTSQIEPFRDRAYLKALVEATRWLYDPKNKEEDISIHMKVLKSTRESADDDYKYLVQDRSQGGLVSKVSMIRRWSFVLRKVFIKEGKFARLPNTAITPTLKRH